MTEPQPDDIHVIAIDWSGRADGGARYIWLAEVVAGQLVQLENGQTRQQVAEYLIARAKENPYLVVGLDFAFSFPEWFAKSNGLRNVDQVWAFASQTATSWLETCPPPFWGRPGTMMPRDVTLFRQTELDVQDQGLGKPKSVFQINGPGTVGTGSLRGMPVLRILHQAGFWIWPFPKNYPPGWPRVIEIYPRALIGTDDMADPPARRQYIANHFPSFPPQHLTTVAESRDAFDAAVSALTMWENLRALINLTPTRDRQTLLEGEIWLPSPSGMAGANVASGSTALGTASRAQSSARGRDQGDRR